MSSQPPANSFNLLRLLAATLVIYAHGYQLGGRGDDPVAYVTGGATSGAVGVFMFFSMSGWLVTQSFASDPHVGRFLARRLLRIMPAFVCTVLAMAFVLGPAVTTLPVRAYLADPATHAYLRGLLVFPVLYQLPGVFVGNPLTDSVNGSLWTLGPEIFCYGVVVGLGLFAAFARHAAAIALVLVVLAHHYLVRHMELNPEFLFMNVRLLLELMVYFVSGALLWHYRALIALSWLAIPLAGVALWLFGGRGYGQLILFALLPYCTLAVALRDSGTAGFFDRIGDWSYGTYLWAFPIQQTLIWLYPALPLAHYVVAAVALAWMFGALSWHVIEKHALRLKPVTRSCAAPQPAR